MDGNNVRTGCPSTTIGNTLICDCVLITWQRQTNDNGRWKGVSYTQNSDTPHINQISDEGKGCDMVDTAHAVSQAKTL